MKPSIYFIPALLFAATFLSAQPVLQNNVFPEIGDLITFTDADSNAIQEGPAGANLTWNFGGLTAASGTAPSTVEIVEAAQTPYASEFPAANLAAKGGDAPDFSYSYFQAQTNQLSTIGIGGADFLVRYTNPEILVKTPMNFNTMYTDTYTLQIESPGSPDVVVFDGTVTRKYDAYGTLVLPSGTYNNAMRVKSVDVSADTTDFGGGIVSISNSTTTSYDWYIANRPLPQVSITYSESQSIFVIPGIDTTVTTTLDKSVSFISNLTTPVTDLAGKDAALSVDLLGPVPATDVLRFQYRNVLGDAPMQASVVDAGGRLMYREALKAGESLEQVPVAGWPAGTYYLVLSNGNGQVVKGWEKL